MSAGQNFEERAETRVRELKDIGLGGFAELIADAETHPADCMTEMEARPGAQTACPSLSDAEKDQFEAQFQNAFAPSGAGAGAGPRRAVSFASAFKISGANGEHAPGRGDASGAHEIAPQNRFASVFADRAIAESEARQDHDWRPRPLGRSDFDLGAFYDRIGLAHEDAGALSRVLRRDHLANGEVTSAEDDLRRVERLLESLDHRLCELDQAGSQEAGCELVGGEEVGVSEMQAVPDDIPVMGAAPIAQNW